MDVGIRSMRVEPEAPGVVEGGTGRGCSRVRRGSRKPFQEL